MYIEKIRRYMKENNFINPQPPVELSMIAEAESKLGVGFPDELKKMLSEMNGDKWLLWSVEQIVDDNMQIREYLADCYEGINELLFIAGNGCGDYYAYSIQNGQILTTEMIIWEHEDNSKTFVAHSLLEMIDRYYNSEI